MIYQNNYFYAGTTAIIYKYELDYNDLGFIIDSLDNATAPSNSLIEEIGIEYKESDSSNWNRIVIMTGGLAGSDISPRTENADYEFSTHRSSYTNKKYGAIYTVIKNLLTNTQYNIRSYYISSGNTAYFNECAPTTMSTQDITYECTEVTGGTEEENEELKSRINSCCAIYNCMTSFSIAGSVSDYLGSMNGGAFTATIDKTMGGTAGLSTMVFYKATVEKGVIVHEMAHNLMYASVDETNAEYPNEIVKFMEFATHRENATWKWLDNHNYPVISSAQYTGIDNYLVAAACYICRKASNNL